MLAGIATKKEIKDLRDRFEKENSLPERFVQVHVRRERCKRQERQSFLFTLTLTLSLFHLDEESC